MEKSLLNRIKTLPPIVFIAVALVVLGSGLVLGQMTISRHTLVTRTADMTVTADQPLHLYGDDLEGSVEYTVTNIGSQTYTVTVLCSASTGLVPVASPDSFVLTPSASQVVTLTLTFVDPSYTSGDCSISFSHT